MGESVNGRIFLASITRTDLGDGFSVERERFTDGKSAVRAQVPTRNVGTEDSFGGTQKDAQTPRDVGERIVRLPAWHELRSSDSAALAIDRRAELGRAF